MSPSLALTITIAEVVIAACVLLLTVGVAVFANDLRRAITSLEQLAHRLETKLDPMEKQIAKTLTDTQQTLEEVRTQAAEIGQTNQLVRDRIKDITSVVTFVAERVELPVVRTLSMAAGVRAGLISLIDGLRKRKGNAHHG